MHLTGSAVSRRNPRTPRVNANLPLTTPSPLLKFASSAVRLWLLFRELLLAKLISLWSRDQSSFIFSCYCSPPAVRIHPSYHSPNSELSQLLRQPVLVSETVEWYEGHVSSNEWLVPFCLPAEVSFVVRTLSVEQFCIF
jgi:hypothetical protein